MNDTKIIEEIIIAFGSIITLLLSIITYFLKDFKKQFDKTKDMSLKHELKIDNHETRIKILEKTDLTL